MLYLRLALDCLRSPEACSVPKVAAPKGDAVAKGAVGVGPAGVLNWPACMHAFTQAGSQIAMVGHTGAGTGTGIGLNGTGRGLIGHKSIGKIGHWFLGYKGHRVEWHLHRVKWHWHRVDRA